MRTFLMTSVVVSLCSCSESSGARAKEQLEALQKKKEAQVLAQAKGTAKSVVPPVESVKLPAPYDENQAVVITADGSCPEGLWALFAGQAPGSTPEEKKANEGRRKELAERAKAQKYLAKLRAPAQVQLAPHDAAAGKFEIAVQGSIDCVDALGRISLAWTDAKAGSPGNSAAKADADFAQQIWLAPPVTFELPMKALSEAKAFYDSNRFGLSARVAFSLGQTEVDKKMRQVKKVTEKVGDETLTIGGGSEDWGAGRLVRVDLLGLRVATEFEKKVLFEKGPR